MPSTPPTASHNYDPLPLTLDDHAGDTLYNAPPSPGPGSGFNTPQLGSHALPSETSIPPGAGQPRFMGAAAMDGYQRESFASSQSSFPSGHSEYNNSVYALNPQDPQSRNSSFTTRYQDDPDTLPMSPVGTSQSRFMEEKRATYMAPRAKSRRKMYILLGVGGGLLLILAVLIPVYFAVVKPKSGSSNGGSSSDNSKDGSKDSSKDGSKSGSPSNLVAKTGGDGSKLTMEDGTTFTYNNSFGGVWYWDMNDPLNNNAQAQSWSPPLNTTFKYGVDKIRGVNLGGWLNTEPFIVPALYQKYSSNSPAVVDEWTLSQAMAADSAGGGLNQMEDHYKTFITEKDFAEIAGAGLNWVRIPIGWWAIETRDGEPLLAKTSWTYFLKAIQWARKYGIRINLDLHAVPGSQNGWNHSGRLGTINFLNGPMGVANAQRALDYIRIIAEFISQPQYKDVVAMFGILNEPQGPTFGKDSLSSFYLQAYNAVRTASGTGEGNGPYISLHDGFFPQSQWAGFLPNGDRLNLDSHPYLCFQDQSDAPYSSYAKTPCTTWGSNFNKSMGAFGLSSAGEWSNAVTDCGLFVTNVGEGTRYEGTYKGDGRNWPRMGSCDEWTDWQKWDDQTKKDIKTFALASMDALQNYFFWTWKIGPSLTSNVVEAPAWSYQLGLENGWMPKDPRDATGVCGNSAPWDPPLQAWQTGGAGAGSLPAAITDQLPWPPATISAAGPGASLQTYAPQLPLVTLPAPTFATTSGASVKPTATVDLGSGWKNSADNQQMMAMPSGCPQVDPWIGPNADVTPCTGK